MANEQSVSRDMPLKWQLVVMIMFMVGVLASHYLEFYMAGSPGRLVDWSWRYLVFAAIVTLAAFPAAYQGARENRASPTLVQIGMVFLTGMGWDKLLSAVHYASG